MNEGDLCNACGLGKLVVTPDGDCYCAATRAPCAACENSRLVCDLCGDEPAVLVLQSLNGPVGYLPITPADDAYLRRQVELDEAELSLHQREMRRLQATDLDADERYARGFGARDHDDVDPTAQAIGCVVTFLVGALVAGSLLAWAWGKLFG